MSTESLQLWHNSQEEVDFQGEWSDSHGEQNTSGESNGIKNNEKKLSNVVDKNEEEDETDLAAQFDDVFSMEETKPVEKEDTKKKINNWVDEDDDDIKIQLVSKLKIPNSTSSLNVSPISKKEESEPEDESWDVDSLENFKEPTKTEKTIETPKIENVISTKSSPNINGRLVLNSKEPVKRTPEQQFEYKKKLETHRRPNSLPRTDPNGSSLKAIHSGISKFVDMDKPSPKPFDLKAENINRKYDGAPVTLPQDAKKYLNEIDVDPPKKTGFDGFMPELEKYNKFILQEFHDLDVDHDLLNTMRESTETHEKMEKSIVESKPNNIEIQNIPIFEFVRIKMKYNVDLLSMILKENK